MKSFANIAINELHRREAEAKARERRNRIAEGFAFALAASPNAADFSASDIANHATLFADTLIEELDK